MCVLHSSTPCHTCPPRPSLKLCREWMYKGEVCASSMSLQNMYTQPPDKGKPGGATRLYLDNIFRAAQPEVILDNINY
jgi:hypothetical protein